MRRIAYAVFGVAGAGLAIWLAVAQHASGWLVLFAIAPDLSFLLGAAGSGLQRGQCIGERCPSTTPCIASGHRR